MNKKITSQIKKLPQKPGIYIFKDKTGRILYVGKAINIKNRIRSHFVNYNSPQPPLNLRGGVNKIADIDYIQTANEKEALILENELIKKYQPRYNIQWRDDKSYFWVAFSNDEWPRVQIVHKNIIICHPELGSGSQEMPKQVRHDKKIKYNNLIGPFVNSRELKQTLRVLRKIFPYRTCKNLYDNPCLQWHLGLCPAHNPNLKFKIENLKLQSRIETYLNVLNGLRQLLRIYAGESIRTEAYDISNIQGTYATGSMIVFSGQKPKKSDYRRFKIKTVRGANDIAMLEEVLRRRLNHSEWPAPDLILIDGGRAQLNAATQSLVASRYSLIPIIALAKREEELYTEYSGRALKISALPLSLRLTFQAIRDEAHRFAIFYYRHLHAKQFKSGKSPKRNRKET